MWDVIWTPEAEIQLHNILTFGIENNGSQRYSQKITNEVKKITTILSFNPFFGQEYELISFSSKIRRAIVLDNFSMLYQVTDKVEILTFWDNRQDPNDLKL